jgi:hypothetical protein
MNTVAGYGTITVAWIVDIATGTRVRRGAASRGDVRG